MKTKILYILIGGAIGFFSAKHIYQKRANEEIASVIEEFDKLKKDIKEKEIKSNQAEAEKTNKAEAIRKNYASAIEKNKKTLVHEIINDAEFDTCEDSRGIPYMTDTLYYYEDGIFANAENDVVDNIKELIGTDDINFGNSDALYFRNHKLKLDVEILRTERTFADIKEKEYYYEEDVE